MRSVDGTKIATRVLVPALMLVSFGIRYYAATTVPMPYDETFLVGMTERIVLTPGEVKLPLHGHGYPAGALYLAKLGALLLGHNLIGFRFMSVVLGAATCWVLYALVRRVWGVWPATLSLFLLCFDGFHIGISRFVIERTYLFFSMLAIYLFWRAVDEDRPWFLVAAGAALGVGALVSEHPLLLLPAFLIYLMASRPHRHWLKRWGPYAALLVMLVLWGPVMYYYLTTPNPLGVIGAEDMSDHPERLKGLGLSYGPLALYVPPLYYTLSDRISVYPVTSLVGGVLMLAAVLWAHFARLGPFGTLMLVIFWVFFGSFSLLTSPRPEFKWAATSLFAAAALAGRLLWELWRRRLAYGILSCLALLYIAGFGIWVANSSHNCYYSPIVPPSQERITRQALKEGLYTVSWPHYDFAALSGSPFFRARYSDYYFHRYITYARESHRAGRDPQLVRLLLGRAAYIRPDDPEVRRLQDELSRARPSAEEVLAPE